MSPSLGKLANLEQCMHKSKLAGFIIDCQTTDLDRAAEFWGSALGMPVRALPPGEGEIYKKLEDSHHGLHIEVQAVTHPSRVHLDIESDDVEAEVQRLETLGATRIQQISTWWVMEAPTGQRFCVVPATSQDFDAQASEWR
jgi:predicted enzyme related to lactoylglutathione lyase